MEDIKCWFSEHGEHLCVGGWCLLRDLYIDYIVYTQGSVRCSDREFGKMLVELGCESKRVSDGIVYRLVKSGTKGGEA